MLSCQIQIVIQFRGGCTSSSVTSWLTGRQIAVRVAEHWSVVAVHRVSHTVAAQTTKITSIEQIVGSLLARVTTLEAGATSGSSGPDSARSWNTLGHGDGSTDTGSLGSHGPGSSDDNRNTRRRLDTFSSPEDEHTRSAVLLHFPPSTSPTEFIAKQVPYPLDLYSEKEPSVRTLWHDTKMMVSPYEVDSPFCNISTKVTVRQSKSLEYREIGRRLAPLWKVLSANVEMSML